VLRLRSRIAEAPLCPRGVAAHDRRRPRPNLEDLGHEHTGPPSVTQPVAPQGRLPYRQFSRIYSRITPFTSDKALLREAVLKLSAGNPGTCLMQALQHSMATLHMRAGHKLLFVISDGAETCRLRNFMVEDPSSRHGKVVQYLYDEKSRTLSFHVDPDALADTVLLARTVGAPVYVLRVNRDEASPRFGVRVQYSKGWEGVALETGGRAFTHGEVYGLTAALRDVVEDLRSTWLLDIDLPVLRNEERKRLLELHLPTERNVALR
jgi:hypothetical protein